MRLIRLEVEDFGPVKSASVPFGPGLNVLYGENDLGKSFLGQAIRAALLLPHESTAHQQFVAWGTDKTPQVSLIFQDRQEMYWRVKKAFGKTAGAASTLESSPNGQQWSMETKARGVDGKLRELLAWGIPEPGGKGKNLPRGALPQSFLTHVLLAQQDGAIDVFGQSLEGDPDETGKQLLGRALQALAQDPLFKAVLEQSQSKVDEAFSAAGNKRRGKHSPFTQASLAIRRAREEYARAKEELEDTERVRQQVAAVSEERLEAKAARDDAEATLKALEGRWQEQQTYRRLAEELAAAQAQVDQMKAAEDEEARLAAALTEHEQALAKAQQTLVDAEATFEAARERVRKVESDEGANRRELEKEQLAKRLLELQAAERDTRTRLEAAEKVGVHAKKLEDLNRQIEDQQKTLGEAEVALATLDEKKKALEDVERQLRGVDLLQRFRRAVAEHAEAKEAQEQLTACEDQAKAERHHNREILARLGERALPGTEDIAALRALDQELKVARAVLEVGLAVHLRLAEATDLEVRRDGGEREATAGAQGEHTFESKGAMSLRLGDLAEVEITAGDGAHRRQVEALEEGWRTEAQGVLDAAGVDTVEELATAVRDAEEARRAAHEHLAEAERLEAEGARLAELAALAVGREARVREREAALEGFDRMALEAMAEIETEATLGMRQRSGEDALRKVDAQREAKRGEWDRGESNLGHLKRQAEEERRQSNALKAAFDQPWEEELREAQEELRRLATEREEISTRRATLEEAHGTALADVQEAVQAAEEQLEQARAQVSTRATSRDAAKGTLESKRGELGVLRGQAARLEISALLTAAEKAREAFSGTGEEPVTEERITAAREALEQKERLLADRSRELSRLQGALEQVGGGVAVEREKGALEALRFAREREEDLELEYSAWRLLTETLREAENEESMHLGRALMEPVSAKFEDLTKGRYGKIGLDPDLKTTGIAAAGDHREVEALSQGLKEQLATIFRLSVAQHLESMIVLDDHLTHTDPDRLSWFRDVLRQSAEEIQIIVLTCRPQDYLLDREMVKGGATVKDGPSGRLRGVALDRVVERIATSS